MAKRILVPLDGSSFADTAVEYGCIIAKKLDAELTGMAVLDLPGIEKSIGTVPAGASHYIMRLREAIKLKEIMKEEEKELIDEILEKFTTKCSTEGVRHRVSRDQGFPGDVIVQKGAFFDATIIGLCTHFQYNKSNAPGGSLDRILDSSVTPLLAVPDQFSPLENSKVLIAFDGSEPAIRALHQFAEIMPCNLSDNEITLIIGDDDKLKSDFLLENAERYLNSHGFTNIEKKWITRNIINAFEEEYSNEYDLFVMGMHSKRTIADFFVGSLSKYMINKKTKPIFLGQ